jgi:hypothetical protein
MSCVAREDRRAKWTPSPSSRSLSNAPGLCCRRKLIRPELDNLRANYPRTAEPFLETKDPPLLSLERS